MSARKLTDEQVIRARQMYRDGASYPSITEHVGVSRNACWLMLVGKTYASVPGSLLISERRHGGARKGSKRGVIEACIHKGDEHGRATLSDLEVSYIKAHLNEGVARILLVKYFKTTKSRISDIATERCWSHIKPHANPPPIRFSERTIRLEGERLKAKFKEVRARA